MILVDVTREGACSEVLTATVLNLIIHQNHCNYVNSFYLAFVHVENLVLLDTYSLIINY